MLHEYSHPVDPRQELSRLIAVKGPVPTVRVSSAQARGAAKKFAYWGAARYEIRLRKRDMVPVMVARERASSDRRSIRLAERDAEEIALAEGRYESQTIGELSRDECAKVLNWLDS